eukprot:4502721-Alexandrium_andersonii.AAC.1
MDLAAGNRSHCGHRGYIEPGLQDAIIAAVLNQQGWEHLKTLLRTGQDRPPPEPPPHPPPDPHQEPRLSRDRASPHTSGAARPGSGTGAAAQPGRGSH